MQDLKEHLLLRLLGLDYDGDERIFTSDKRNNIEFANLNSVVESKLLQINYMTYDICQDYDTVQTRSGDVLMMSLRDKQHPFWYAQIIHAFHIQVLFCHDGISWSRHHMEVL